MKNATRIPWAELAVFLVILIAGFALYREFHETPGGSDPDYPSSAGSHTLAGQVSLRGGGTNPVAATVYIISAHPRDGVETVAGTSWPDCAKHVTTDAQGKFEISGLDSSLTFEVVAAAPGYQPATADRADPAKRKLVRLALPPIEVSNAEPGQTLSGRVLDPQGKPIAGAMVTFVGYQDADGGGSYGRIPGIDQESVTDDQGNFLLTDKKPFATMLVKASARGYAEKNFDRLASGSPHDLTLTPGAELRGRLVWPGHSLAGVKVGVAGANRGMGDFLGHFTIATDREGRFDFKNLPPEGDFRLYTEMDSMKGRGAAIPVQVQTGKEGESTDAGDVVVGPAYRLAGNVVLADGQAVPPKTTLYLGRENGWDGQQVRVGTNGAFNVQGVPPEIMSLMAQINGYHVSSHNRSVDLINPFRLVGRVDHDITNLVLLMDKGPAPQPDYANMDPDYQDMRNRPLTGAEGGQDHAGEWTVAGHVFDQDTKQLLQNFTVTPGQVNQYNQTAWTTIYAVAGSNGTYETYFSKRAAEPLLKVEAHGYLPQRVALNAQDSPNTDIYLQKGSGPAGEVLTADGQPATGATVLLLTEGYNRAALTGTELTTYGDKTFIQKADDHGYFSFEPRLGMDAVAAASADGFAIAALTDFNAHGTIRLQAFGRITGTLTRPSGPGTNETLDVRLDDTLGGRINLQTAATTDREGHFFFEHVPPGRLSISYRQMMPAPNRGWMTQPLEDVEVQPGQTLVTNISAPDRVAADSARNYQQPPPPKRIAGAEIKGVVLSPDGQPAGDADVALQVPGTYLSIGRGAFDRNNLREEGRLVSTGPDGSFTLPLFEGAQSIIALSLAGYAQVPLDQLKQSPQVTLQKWGRIEGTLRTNHHPGTNETVTLSAARSGFARTGMRGMGRPQTTASRDSLTPPVYNFSAFQAKTDGQGRFVLTFVPPGEAVINRQIPLGGRSSTYSPLLTVTVQAGETLVTNVGGAGRSVVGKIKLNGDTKLDFKNAFSRLGFPMTKYLEKYNALKTDADRLAFAQSEEGQKAMKANNYGAIVRADGTFQAEDVVPGTYELTIQPRMSQMPLNNEWKGFSSQELTIPPPKDDADDSTVDVGEVAVTEHRLTMPKPASGK